MPPHLLTLSNEKLLHIQINLQRANHAQKAPLRYFILFIGRTQRLRPSYMINKEHSRQKAPTSDTFEPMCSISHGFNLFVLMATVENVGGFSRREAVGGGGRWCLAVLRGASRPQSPPQPPPQSPPTSPPTSPPAVREAFLSGNPEPGNNAAHSECIQSRQSSVS